MDANPKALREALDQRLEWEVRFFRAGCSHKIQHRFGELVCALRATLARQQAIEPVFPQGPVGFVVGDPGKSEAVRGTRHGPAIAVYTTQHLVFDLQKIVDVEESVFLEQGIVDRLGMGIEAVVVPQCTPLEGFAHQPEPNNMLT